MQEVRCLNCNKLLYKIFPDRFGSLRNEVSRSSDVNHFALIKNAIECKCPRCGEMNTKKEKESVENDK